MKKTSLCLILGILLISSIGFVIGEENDTNNDTDVCDSEHLDLCLDETNCTDAGGYWHDNVCIEETEEGDDEEDEDDENGKGKQGLGQTIRNRVKAGVYTSPDGQEIRVRELAQNRLLLQSRNFSANCDCDLVKEQVQNRTKLKFQLSNGRKAELKVMPDVAGERAIERLRLKVCSEENNCSIELKEVGKGNKTRAAYEVQVQRHMKLLGLFKIKAMNKAQIDAETGEVIAVKKPWWAFLATEPEE